MRKYLWCMFAILLAVIMVHPALFAQAAGDDNAGNALDWGKAELLKYLIPLISSYVYAAWNRFNGLIARWSNPLKMVVYIAMVTVVMLLGELVHVAVSHTVADWTGTFWEGLVGGLVGTLLVKIGIATAQPASVAKTTA